MNKSEIMSVIREAHTPQTKRDIARALGLKGSGPRVALKQILKQLEAEGEITKIGGAYAMPDGLPGVMTLEVCDVTIDGDVLARPLDRDGEGDMPRIEIMPDKKGHPAVKQGDRVLARLTRIDKNEYEARIIRRMDQSKERLIGQFRRYKKGFFLIVADKKARENFEIAEKDTGGASDGALVVAELQPSRGKQKKKVRVVEIIGKQGDPGSISLISLHEAGLNERFPEPVLKDSKDLTVPGLKQREDLRDIPLVTIDGADARDFDDAVYAEKTAEGYHIIVAIADVAYYVRPGSPMDKEALRRGNSTYFPDRVIPMLPEAISNDLCSLRPKENRACLAMHLWIDGDGRLTKYKVVRGLMRSAARLIYEDVQKAYDRQDNGLMPLLGPLYEAYSVLDKARAKRGALELDLPERQIIIDDKGNMTGVEKRTRLDAHKLIEEFMILANVAAAKALEDRKASCVYRVHEPPSLDKLDSVRDFIESFGLSLPKGQVIKPGGLNHILSKASKLPYSHLISEVVLRSQSQAVYSAENRGHFGLALSKYAHFTSPIRRYADLLVHRSLIEAYGLGPGGLSKEEEVRLTELCDHISQTERVSMQAERNAVDRFTTAYLSSKLGEEFAGRISGVTRFGLFVSLNESGADGLVPISTLPQDFYDHHEDKHALIGRRRKKVFRLGADVTVRVKEADGLTGSTVLELVGHKDGAEVKGMDRPDKKKPPPKKNHGRGKPPARSGKNKKKTTPKHIRRKNKNKGKA